MQKPSAVVFDLGKVLLDFDYGKVASQMLKYCDLPRGNRPCAEPIATPPSI